MENFIDFQFDYSRVLMSPETTLTDKAQSSPDDQGANLFEEITQGKKKAYRCLAPGCNKVFKFKSDMSRHTIIHNEDRPYCCTYEGCKKAFKRPDALENHIRIHAGVQPFECTVADCGQKFSTKAALRYHEIKHNNNRVYRCEFAGCGKSFLTPAQLKQHQRAYNYHLNWYATNGVGEEPRKMAKICPKELFGDIEYENQKEDNFDGYSPEQLKGIIKYILKENHILKQKVEHCERCLKTSSESQETDFQIDNDSPTSSEKTTVESSSFFGASEFDFLNFIKRQEDKNPQTGLPVEL